MAMDGEQNEEDSIMDLSYEADSPLAPPVELLEQLVHYDWSFQDGGQTQSSPPSVFLRKLSDQRGQMIFLQHSIPIMTEEMARHALLSFVNSRCCYGNRAAGELVIQDLRQQMLYRYRLETFSESRLSEWTFQPYTNHSVDGPKKGTSPRPWDIKVHVPPMFQEETKKFQVPHSSLVKDCHKCQGRGRYKCSGCHGAGTMRCASCSGAKRKAKQSRRCQVCSGSGRKRQLYSKLCEGRDPDFSVPYAESDRRQTVELIPLTEVHYWYQGKSYLYYIYGLENKVYAADYPERYCCGCTII
ncbi:protein SSUH2 homolog [Gracilinanus agilis]|uniref:protein SSUH2 homolog n=1 Tax=Gracilinanus agilis TaxID=191870 RepID=UPI001CFE375A|nr:protein SSUH2 homolog [Gracilinanus agilis]